MGNHFNTAVLSISQISMSTDLKNYQTKLFTYVISGNTANYRSKRGSNSIVMQLKALTLLLIIEQNIL